jgi:hypothetical protein
MEYMQMYDDDAVVSHISSKSVTRTHAVFGVSLAVPLRTLRVVLKSGGE